MKDNFGKIADTFDCLKRDLEHADGGSESRGYTPAALPRKRKRSKMEEPTGPAA